MLNADYNPYHGHPEFPPLFTRLAWRYLGETRWAQLYAPTIDALRWDGVENVKGHDQLAIGLSGDKGFAYVSVRVTARQDKLTGEHNLTQIPGGGCRGVKCKVVFNVGSEDESVVDGWMVNDGS